MVGVRIARFKTVRSQSSSNPSACNACGPDSTFAFKRAELVCLQRFVMERWFM